MLLERGNIILESSFDRNITFRARGQGAVNMITEHGTVSLSHQMVGINSDLLSRIELIEGNLNNGRLLADRLSTLEDRVHEIAVNKLFKKGFE